MSYRDSTDDGFEGEMLEGGQDPTDFELVAEAERIFTRLTFLSTWRTCGRWPPWPRRPRAATRPTARRRWPPGWPRPRQSPAAAGVAGRGVPLPDSAAAGHAESLVEYDRRRSIKETLLEQIIAAAVETADAGRVIRAGDDPATPGGRASDPWEQPVEQMLRAGARRRRGRRPPAVARFDRRTGRAAAVVRRPGPRRQPAADRRLARAPGHASPPVGLSAPAGPADGNRRISSRPSRKWS